MRADVAIVAAALTLALTACHQQLGDQPRCEPLAASALFTDGMCARAPVAGTVPHGATPDVLVRVDPNTDRFPTPITPALLARGRERFDIYCAPCHDRAATGRGMIVERGYTAPPSFHIDRLRAAPAGHFVDVMTHGFGAMPAYAAQVPLADRWAITAYIRALQRSQHASLDDVPPEERSGLIAEQPRS